METFRRALPTPLSIELAQDTLTKVRSHLTRPPVEQSRWLHTDWRNMHVQLYIPTCTCRNMHPQLYLPTCTHTCSHRHLYLHSRTQTSGCIKGPLFSLPVEFVTLFAIRIMENLTLTKATRLLSVLRSTPARHGVSLALHRWTAWNAFENSKESSQNHRPPPAVCAQ